MSAVALERVHVDRHREFERFGQMLTGSVRQHILLIRAGEGMGKTSLLVKFRELCREHLLGFVNLRRVTYTPHEVLDDLARQLGSQHFATYKQQQVQFTAPSQVVVADSQFSHSRLDVSIAPPGTDQMEARRRVLTRAFFEDVARSFADRTCVVMFDTYEAASTEVEAWLSGAFMSSVRGSPRLVLVIAGRRVPQVDVDWEEWLLCHDMQPLDYDSVAEYARLKGLTLAPESIQMLLAATQGQPLRVSTAVDTFLWQQRR